jgi:hypothetical protein
MDQSASPDKNDVFATPDALTDGTNDEPQKTENGRKGSVTYFDTAAPSRIDPNVLITESPEEFSAICEELRKEIKPKTFIERMYVDDMAAMIWEIKRMRRLKSNLIRNTMQSAVQSLLDKKLDTILPVKTKNLAQRVIAGWFGNEKGQASAQDILTSYQLEQNEIEAEAWRLASPALDSLERLLTLLESRRDKTLRMVTEYRVSLARQLKDASQRMIEADE